MARMADGLHGGAPAETHKTVVSAAGEDHIQIPNADFVRHAELSREGQDLVIHGPDGSVIVVEGYFSASPAPSLDAPGGLSLTPGLVHSFLNAGGEVDIAAAGTHNDASPVGKVQDVSGHATVTHPDGTSETISIGTPIFEGDVVETDDQGAVNILFTDESTFAVSESARLAIDQYVFDPGTDSGASNFSMLRGLFVFTSGLIGREDPDDVSIETPMGSIGIRGTIIAGNADTGVITVVEGAIVLRTHDGQEATLATRFETARFDTATNSIEMMGTRESSDLGENFSSMSSVAPAFFTGIGVGNQHPDNGNAPGTGEGQGQGQSHDPARQTAPQDGDYSQKTGDQKSEAQQQNQDRAPGKVNFKGEDNTFKDNGKGTFGDHGHGGHDSAPKTGAHAGGPRNPGGGQGGSGPAQDEGKKADDKKADGDHKDDHPPQDPRSMNPPADPAALNPEIDRETIDEDAAPGTLVATVSLPGTYTTITYTLVDDMGGKLVLDTVSMPGKALVKIASGANLNNIDSAIFRINVTADGKSGGSRYEVNVDAVNHDPVAKNDAVNSSESASVSGSVLSNNGSGADSDPDSDTLTVSKVNSSTGSVGSGVTGSHGGAFTINANGTFTFNPLSDFDDLGKNQTRTTSVSYTVKDPGGKESTATVTVTVKGSDDSVTFTSNKNFTGTVRADDIHLTGDTNVIHAGDGADVIAIDGDNNTVYGENGNDDFIVAGNNNILLGGDSASSGLSGNTVLLSGNNNNYTGGDHHDIITITGQGNSIDSGNGGDTLDLQGDSNLTIATGDGNDTIDISGDNNTSINTGDGDDTITIAANADGNTVTSGDGDNQIDITGSNNTFTGGNGGNIINIRTGSHNDTITTGSGNDTLAIASGSQLNLIDVGDGNNTLNISGNQNTITSGDDNDTLHLIGLDATVNTIHLNGGVDIVTIDADASHNTIDTGTGNKTFTISGDYNDITTTTGADTITLNDTADHNTIDAGDGNNSLSIAGSNNTLTAGSGIDDITIEGDSADTNAINAGAGNDQIIVGSSTVAGAQESGNTINAGDGSDDIYLNISAGTGNEMSGDAGDDIFHIRRGNLPTGTKFTGGTGNDKILFDSSNSSGTFTFTSSNMSSIEKIYANDTLAQTLDITLNSSFLASLESKDLTIKLDSLDTLILTLTGLGFTGTTSSTQDIYTNSSGYRITIDHESATTLNIIGAGGTPASGGLGLGDLGLDPGDGFVLNDNNDEGFGYSFAALGDVDGDGYDDIGFTKNINDDGPTNGRVFLIDGSEDDSPIDISTYSKIDVNVLSDTPESMRIAGIGDFNGDGIRDYLVGQPDVMSEGSIVVISGGLGGNAATFNDILFEIKGEPASLMGASLSGLGDLNHDGYADIIVGSPATNGLTDGASGAVYIMYGGPGKTSLDFSTATTLNQPVFVGSDTGGAGADIAISSTYAYVLSNNLIDVYDISSVNPVNIGQISLLGGDFADANSISIQSDGYAYITTAGPTGKFLIADITPTGLTATWQISMVNPIRAFLEGGTTFIVHEGGVAEYDQSHNALSSSITNSNTKDVVFNDGKAYVWSEIGKTITLNVYDVGYTSGDPPVDTISVTGGTVFNEHAMVTYDHFIYIAGDDGIYIVDKDNLSLSSHMNVSGGVKDLLVENGTLYLTEDGVSAGTIRAYDLSDPANAASLTTFRSLTSDTMDDPTALAVDGQGFVYTANLSGISASDFHTHGAEIFDVVRPGFGTGVASVGDFNADGYNDFLVYSDNSSVRSVAIYSGKDIPDQASLPLTPLLDFTPQAGSIGARLPAFGIGDFNGDGISDVAIGDRSASTLRSLHIFCGDTSPVSTETTIVDFGDGMGGGGIIMDANTIGDFNGDGFDDVTIAVRNDDKVDIYVLYGSATPQSNYDDVDLKDQDNAFHITYTIPAGKDPDDFAIGVGAAGDVNGDGYYDLVISFPDMDSDIADGVDTSDGSSFVIYGRLKAGDSASDTAGGNGDHLVGTSGNDTLDGASFQGVTFRGGGGDDTILISSGSAFKDIDGGAGHDSINISGNIDFSGVGLESVRRIENIHMIGSSDHLTLDMKNIFSILQASDDGRLEIDFDNVSGKLDIKGAGGSDIANATTGDIAASLHSDGAVKSTDGEFYEFKIGSYTLAIDSHVVDAANVTLTAAS